MKITPDDLNQRMIDMMSQFDRDALGLVSSADVAVKTAKVINKAEAQTQREVEGWLRLQGYWPRTPEFLDGRRPPRGWYIHIHEAKRNPILLDLLVLDLSGRWCEIELKTRTGAIRDAQAAILASGGVLARSSQEAIDAVTDWIREIARTIAHTASEGQENAIRHS